MNYYGTAVPQPAGTGRPRFCVYCSSRITRSPKDGAWEDSSGACGCGDGEHSPSVRDHDWCDEGGCPRSECRACQVTS